MRRNYLILLLILVSTNITVAQQKDTSLVQFSGVVVTADSLKPIPFVSILIKQTYHGTISDFYGFFSFVAHKGDEIVFSSMGYKTVFYTIPDTLMRDRYSLIQVMRPDTLIMNETVIYPWPTYEQFKQAFVKLDIPDDDMERARKNIEVIEKRIINESWQMDGAMNYRNYIEKTTGKYYYAGQLPPNNLLNPFAWAKFIKAWKDGKFKSKKDKD